MSRGDKVSMSYQDLDAVKVREVDGLDDSDYSSDEGEMIGADRDIDDEYLNPQLTASKKISKFIFLS